MASINQAHLIHDHSSGRSSTRLHAPPGGHSSMGTSFGWTDAPVAPAPGGRKSLTGPDGHGESPIKMDSYAVDSSPGTPGRRSTPLNGARDPRGNAMGSSFGWDAQDSAPPRHSPPAREQVRSAGIQTSSSLKLAIGCKVLYKQLGRAGTESEAIIVDIEPVGSRKDNYKIQFEDGRERNTSEDKLQILEPAFDVDPADGMTQGMAGMGMGNQENLPPRGYEDYGNLSSPGGYGKGGDGYDAQEQQGYTNTHTLRAVEGAGVGELQVGQKMMYRQSARSEPEEVTIVGVELPSTNGHMRTKTFYTIKFSDSRCRETTIDKLKHP